MGRKTFIQEWFRCSDLCSAVICHTASLMQNYCDDESKFNQLRGFWAFAAPPACLYLARMSPSPWTAMTQGKPRIALWPALPQACFHPHPSMGQQMEVLIRSGRRCQLQPLREGLLREGQPFYLFPAPWNLWNELRRFSEAFRNLWTEAGPTSLTQGCCFSCRPQAQSKADFGDMMVTLWHTSIFLRASGQAPLSFYAGQTMQSFLGKSKCTVVLNVMKTRVFSVTTIRLWS